MGKLNRRGHLIIISGPSGVGKGTVCSRLMEMSPELRLSISATTRKKRKGEVEGKNYFFKSVDEFKDLIAGHKLIEFAKVHGNFYGTPKEFVDKNIEEGHDVILEIDVQGAKQVKEFMDGGVFIFLLPPSLKDLEGRLRNRGTENEDQIELRLKNSREEIMQLNDFHYAVINDDVQDCAKRIMHIIDAENQRIDSKLIKFYKEEFND